MIQIKTPQEIETMREGGKVLARVLKEVSQLIRLGITTKELDRAAEALILQSGAKLAFKGYEDFPGVLCTSVNDEVVHSVPGDRVLKEGDIITLDMGLVWKGFYLDMARTFPVGKASPEALRLIRITKKALRIGLKKAKPGSTVGDIGETIQRMVEGQGYGVVRELCGHGIGKELHEDGHGYKTKDGSLSCHFEDTIAITLAGPLVLTQDS